LFCALGSLLPACGGDSAQGVGGSGGVAGGGGIDDVCPPPDRLVAGECLPPGIQDDGCPAGTLGQADGSCRPAGVPAELCGPGFEPAGDGCEPILPSDPCPPGLIAVPGDAACREVAPCGVGKWGDIPTDGTSQHVDLSYAGGDSDGSADKPWTTISAAMSVAAEGAIVAIAEGSYAEDVFIDGRPVLLWGVCPSAVEVVGSSSALAAVTVWLGADGTVVRSLALRGAAKGLVISGAQDVLVDRVWIHDTAGRGVAVEDLMGPTAFTLDGVLIEQVTEVGVFTSGADATVVGSVVRDTQPLGSGQLLGRGMSLGQAPASGARSTVTLRGSLLEGNRDVGLHILSSDVTVQSSVVRQTLPQAGDGQWGFGVSVAPATATGEPATLALVSSLVEDSHVFGVQISGSEAFIEGSVVRDSLPSSVGDGFGYGVQVQSDPVMGDRAVATVSASLVAHNHTIGVAMSNADVTIEGTVVRDTLPGDVDQLFGRGLEVLDVMEGTEPPRLTIRGAVVEHNHDAGLLIIGEETTIEGTVVRDTQPRAGDQSMGRGINFQRAGELAMPPAFTVHSSVLELNHDLGVFIAGVDGTIEGTVIRDTLPRSSNQTGGRGLHIQPDLSLDLSNAVTVERSLVERSLDIGVIVLGVAVTFEGTVVRDTVPRASDGLFGDGVLVAREPGPTSALLSRCRVEDSARVGVAAFGAPVSLAATVLECNAIHMNQEAHAGVAASFEDLGGNRCGCGSAPDICRALSVGLEPPAPMDPGQ